MSKDQPTLEWPGNKQSPPPPLELLQTAVVLPGPSSEVVNQRLIQGENLGVMSALLTEFEGKIDLIYADPPFSIWKSHIVSEPVRGKIPASPKAGRRPRGFTTNGTIAQNISTCFILDSE